MYYFGYIMLVVALLSSAGASALALFSLWQKSDESSVWLKRAHYPTTIALLFASLALLHALFWQDYSLQYAANYTDKYLSLFYRLTAFWAGQPGSMLFWALAVAISGTIFSRSTHHNQLSPRSRLWFQVFFHLIMVFFTLILTTYSNPFIMQSPAPVDGNGLNPLLQNPGMIIHPPLLFIGYAGFVVPFCLALATSLDETSDKISAVIWFHCTRGYLLLAWMFLTAGIMLGAWWAYMELGWGGYWAWDPVENSSLVPWLMATALLHSLALERRTGTFQRFNVLLISLTTISTFFATFLVRSGIVDSVHSFGQSTVGRPLLVAVLIMTVISSCIAWFRPRSDHSLPELLSREGLLAVMTWFLLALSVIILTATLWPVITRLFSSTPGGLDASFYNRVCLPLSALLLSILAFCPLLRSGKKLKIQLLLTSTLFAACIILLQLTAYKNTTASIACAAAVCITIQVLFQGCVALKEGHLKRLGGLGTHLGLALAALGVAFSGPYSLEHDLELTEGEKITVSAYTLTLTRLDQVNGPGFTALQAKLSVEKGKQYLGSLIPERRIYEKFGEMQFSEVDTIPSPGNELYVSLLGLNAGKAVIRFSIKPLVNWLWLGGLLMSLFPLLGFIQNNKRIRSAKEDAGV